MAAVDAPGHSASLPRLFGSQLPIDLLDHILSYLPLFSVGVMTRLSSSFFALLNRDSFWRAWVRRHYGCSIPAASFGSKLMGLARIEWIAFDLLNAHRFSPLSILRTMPRGHVKTFVKIIYTLSAPQPKYGADVPLRQFVRPVEIVPRRDHTDFLMALHRLALMHYPLLGIAMYEQLLEFGSRYTIAEDETPSASLILGTLIRVSPTPLSFPCPPIKSGLELLQAYFVNDTQVRVCLKATDWTPSLPYHVVAEHVIDLREPWGVQLAALWDKAQLLFETMANFSWLGGGEWENCRCIPSQGGGKLSVVWNARFCKIDRAFTTVTSSLGDARDVALTALSDAIICSTRRALLALNLPLLPSTPPNSEGTIKFLDHAIGLQICSLLDSLVFPAGYPDTGFPWAENSTWRRRKRRTKPNPKRLANTERKLSKCPQVALIRAVRHLLVYLTSGLHADWSAIWSRRFMEHSLDLAFPCAQDDIDPSAAAMMNAVLAAFISKLVQLPKQQLGIDPRELRPVSYSYLQLLLVDDATQLLVDLVRERIGMQPRQERQKTEPRIVATLHDWLSPVHIAAADITAFCPWRK